MRRSRGTESHSVQLSKALSWILRHGAEKEGFKFLPGGFLYVDDILKNRKYSKYTAQEVQDVVASNDKQRFHLETDADTGRLKIRANQGHSLEVADLDLQPVTSADELPVVIHGTYNKFWDSICQQGLRRMTRTHIHFAAGEPGDTGVISGFGVLNSAVYIGTVPLSIVIIGTPYWHQMILKGMRGTCDIMIYLDLKKALSGGLKFFRSANNVILTEGNEDGVVTPDFFQKVIDRKTGKTVDAGSKGTALGDPGKGKRPVSKLTMADSLLEASKALEAQGLEDDMHEVEHQRKHRQIPMHLKR